MTRRGYRRPSWWVRVVGNRLAPLVNPAMIARLSVPGRVTGRWRTIPVLILDHDGERYLIAPFGHTDWAANLRAFGQGRLRFHGKFEEFAAEEVPVDERGPMIEAYRRRYGDRPGVAASFVSLPDPTDHPTFRIRPIQSRADPGTA